MIAEWQDDPDMLRRHEIKDEKVYDWATIKRDQRSYDRRLQVEKLKKYWRKVRARRERLRELERFVPDKARTDSKVTMPLKPGFLDGIVAPFSTETQERERVNAFFEKALERPHIQRLPLKELIFSERVTQFSDLPTYTDDPRLERAAKFSAVLRLETDGLVELWQAVPFSDITIKRVAEMEMEVSGTNREGGMEMIDLSDASSRQVCLAKIRSSVFASVGRVTDARYKICRQSRQPD